jgi:Kae1-associated kinase Bud32
VTEFKGAEAAVEVGDTAVKRRPRKSYRHPELDERLRRGRTEDEARLLKRAEKYGVAVPGLVENSEFELEMETVDGDRLKHRLPDTAVMEQLGREVSRLHSCQIIHGDLTSSNVVVSSGEPFLIDFGLAYTSERVEDRAVDIHLLHQVLRSSHPEIATDSWEAFLDGYSELDGSHSVVDTVEDVRSRRRYA